MNTSKPIDKTIQSHFPTKRFNRYLEEFSVLSPKELGISQIEQLFFLAREDFGTGKLTLDDFSGICNVLWSIIEYTQNAATPLGRTLYSGAEITYYVRQASDKEHARIVSSLIKDVLSYKSSMFQQRI